MMKFNKELKRLSRRELVDVIYQLKKNEQVLQDEIAGLKNQLNDKRLRISNAGSIADAAISVTDIFSVAQKTADTYLQEIACMRDDAEKECARKIEEADEKVKTILSNGKQKFEKLKASYQIQYENWKTLNLEIQKLEQKKIELCEGNENG